MMTMMTLIKLLDNPIFPMLCLLLVWAIAWIHIELATAPVEGWQGEDGVCEYCGELISEHPDWELPDRIVKYCDAMRQEAVEYRYVEGRERGQLEHEG